MPPPWAQTPSGALLNCEKKLLCCSYCVGIESFSRGRTLIITHWMARKYSGVFFLRERSLLLVVRICLWKLTLLHVALGVLLLWGFYCIYRYFSLFYSFGFVSFVFYNACIWFSCLFVAVCSTSVAESRWSISAGLGPSYCKVGIQHGLEALVYTEQYFLLNPSFLLKLL